MMETFGGEHFKAIFDFANFVQACQDTLEAYDLLKDHIAYIHVKDALLENGNVVPAGFGDGNVEKILFNLFDSGFDGFLSIEPHLFNFTGFAGLEKGKDRIEISGQKPLNGFEAFSLAYTSLKDILAGIT